MHQNLDNFSDIKIVDQILLNAHLRAVCKRRVRDWYSGTESKEAVWPAAQVQVTFPPLGLLERRLSTEGNVLRLVERLLCFHTGRDFRGCAGLLLGDLKGDKTDSDLERFRVTFCIYQKKIRLHVFCPVKNDEK
ncbi:hypothetical protein E2C01_048440 [Portunus trituberculatus]|uniref:Uncharacterized protein n=1 Tax=Portunus trituberculatus TaxID=210409 RepID=A0A5B7GBL5_PORTR|nr:hypothetical protein [Portunus trituberculatus]